MLLMAPQSHHNDALEWPRFNQLGTTLNETITRDFGRCWIWIDPFILRVCCTNHETLIYYLFVIFCYTDAAQSTSLAGHAVAAIHLCGCAC